MSLGVAGYSVYLGSLWCFQVNNTRWFVIFAGALLGVTAALFWAAQGSIMMSYPREKDKGRSFTVFWVLFQLGTLVGAAIALGIQFDSVLPSVSTAVYITFMVITLTAIFSSWLVLPAQMVVRGDGTLVELEASITPREEAKAFFNMFKDWRMIALLPMFFASNYFYAYQGALTAFLFNGRTRALASLLTGLGSMIGSIVIGLLTDNLPFSRRKRALTACGVVFLLTSAIWAAGLGFQVQFARGDLEIFGKPLPWDWTVGVSAGPILMIFACEWPS